MKSQPYDAPMLAKHYRSAVRSRIRPGTRTLVFHGTVRVDRLRGHDLDAIIRLESLGLNVTGRRREPRRYAVTQKGSTS